MATLEPDTLVNYALGDLARHLHPDWKPDDWFRWPPDLFALTSTVLRASGLYRCAVASPDEWDENERRYSIDREAAARIASQWREWLVGRRRRLPPELRQLKIDLFAESARIHDHMGRLQSNFCQSVLTTHALADEVCANFGLSSGAQPNAELGFVANFHLAVTGSLSLCSQHRGIVLPKIRTPQRGLTVRSFSHHLSFHVTEAQVHWWTLPWFDREADEHSINILAIPLPYVVEPASFQPVQGGEKLGEGRRFGYFRYAPPERAEPGDDGSQGGPSIVEEILALVVAAYREVKHLHLLVLPEVALTDPELQNLRNALVQELFGSWNIPMIVTGVRRTDGKREINEVVISAFYADRWYQLRQHKHHRWKLTPSQIQQYALGGYLNTHQEWWEAMDVPPRRLTFLTPTGWLCLSPLICEDLAQLEPLSDLIRGVGPTLVTALLLDGPQLAQRWPARYAGVLADDPGSSVLTVTALGMARRCRDRGKEVDTTAVSWKDADSPWEAVKFHEDGGVLLSLKAEWNEEFTADGRSDGGASAHMVLQSARTIKSPPAQPRRIPAADGAGNLRKAVDVLELTVFCYLVDAVLDMNAGETGALFSLTRLHGDPDPDLTRRFPAIRLLVANIRAHLQYKSFGEGEEEHTPGSWPSAHFDAALSLVEGFLLVVNERYARLEARVTRLERWKVIAKAAEEMLRRSQVKRPRAEKLAYFTVLWAVHSRLMDAKRWLRKQQPDRRTDSQYEDVRTWLQRIEAVIAEFSTGQQWVDP